MILYWAIFAVAVIAFVAFAVATLDARRQERRRAERIAFKARMQPTWTAGRSVFDSGSDDPARQARGTEAVIRQLRHVASRIDEPPARVPDHQMAGLLAARRRDEP